MSTQIKLTEQTVLEIEIHNKRMIGHCLTAMAKIKQLANWRDLSWAANQVEYYHHAIAAYKWSSTIARQMIETF